MRRQVRRGRLTRAAAAVTAVAAGIAGCTTTPSAPAPSARSSTAAAEGDAELSRARSGYGRIEIDGRPMYCRDEAATGALVPRRRCMSEDQLRNQERRTRALRDRLVLPDACPSDGCGPKDL